LFEYQTLFLVCFAKERFEMFTSTSVGRNTGLSAIAISDMHYDERAERQTWFLHAGQELVEGGELRCPGRKQGQTSNSDQMSA